MKIGIISCSSKKQTQVCKAKDMYNKSTLFRLSLAYCKQNYDKIFILSAKYGIIPLDKIISPYNTTLKHLTKQEESSWNSRVSLWINENLKNDDLYFLVGERYYQNLNISNKINLPLKSLPIGKRLKWLKENIK